MHSKPYFFVSNKEKNTIKSKLSAENKIFFFLKKKDKARNNIKMKVKTGSTTEIKFHATLSLEKGQKSRVP